MGKPSTPVIRIPIRPSIPGAALLVLVCLMSSFAQSNEGGSRNNPFSPSPPRRPRVEVASNKAVAPPQEIRFVMQNPGVVAPDAGSDQKPVIQVLKNASAHLPPTEIYKVGAGDILLISLKNAPQNGGYYTVRPDGTIDFPLAGGAFLVLDQTTEDIARSLTSGIKIFSDPKVEVRVREYVSHKIKVTGLVERPGEKIIQREAMPLFAIRAEAGVDQAATKALVTRVTGEARQAYSLKDPQTDSVLIYPGQAVEFASESISQSGLAGAFYFVSGEVITPGQRELTAGLTLYQALTAAGGPKGDPKKAIIRRKNHIGTLTAFEHNLRAIRDGKTKDPALLAGDVLEIRN